jgi:hypothetical protein
MHRSGTSATTGTLQQQGVALGAVSERNPHNPRGNRENPKLRRLHERILERSGGSWFRPPAEVRIEDDDRRARDEVLAAIEGETIGVKDPRMLLVLELWRDLETHPIGVIRNPVAVRESLERRGREPRQPALSADEGEALWRHYNRILLAELEHDPFPVIDFDRHDELDAQGAAALAFHGVKPRAAEAPFVDRELVSDAGAGDWRDRALAAETLELWDRLAAYVGTPRH